MKHEITPDLVMQVTEEIRTKFFKLRNEMMERGAILQWACEDLGLLFVYATNVPSALWHLPHGGFSNLNHMTKVSHTSPKLLRPSLPMGQRDKRPTEYVTKYLYCTPTDGVWPDWMKGFLK